MDPGSNEIYPTGNTQSQTAGTLSLIPSNSETRPYSYNLRNLPSRVTTTVQNTMNTGQLNLGGLLEIDSQQQPDLQRQENAIEQQRNRRGPIQFKLPIVEIPEAELDDTKCAICLRSAREYKLNKRPVAKTPCGHFFCIPCIFRWKKSSQNCPSCRQVMLNPRPARELYLFHVV
ncbi:hypothetical protein JTE90_013575 [Oedothorax gibbosus]|uniref:RING-type domain-containing protein n=1 Tax=Oedothorax gibbosus TaxID=931172 RepID=A0AAV6VF27_9ARAC|nr:hypothetical protein JTE90_013575 [Oedothorax gibbosus]